MPTSDDLAPFPARRALLGAPLLIASALVLAAPAAPAAAQDETGADAAASQPAPEPIVFEVPRSEIDVVDADTFWMGIHQVKLHGVDTVEPDQTCRRGGAEADCYAETLAFVAAQFDHPRFRCEVHRREDGKPRMSYGRYIATCFAGTTNVNEEMVRRGWAVAANSGVGDAFRDLEASARAARRGLHAMEFDAPWDFRRARREGGG